MEQNSFNSIHNNFKKFLNNKLHPNITSKNVDVAQLPQPTQRIERMERTHAFGKDDCEVGYKISTIDKNGKWRTKIVGTL